MKKADLSKLPHLLKLVDDESPAVRKAVSEELAAFGSTLSEALRGLQKFPTLDQQRNIQALLENHRRGWLEENWPSWFNLTDDFEKLEKAYRLIAEFQNGFVYLESLESLLDALSSEYKSAHTEADAASLAKFLFKTKRLRGERKNYFSPANSNLVYVIKERKGLPISLASIYILVGNRLGLLIEGCNFPGHFLARTSIGGKTVFVDCFNGGLVLEEKDIVKGKSRSSEQIRSILCQKVSAESMVARVLRNLIYAYEQVGQMENRDLMVKLLSMFDREKSRGISTPDPQLN